MVQHMLNKIIISYMTSSRRKRKVLYVCIIEGRSVQMLQMWWQELM